MTLPVLAVMLAGLAAAQARNVPEGPTTRPVDPASLSPAARAAFEKDPAAFREEHAGDLETLRRWNQDPALGRQECADAGKDPRSCMEGRLQELSQVATPQALAVINSYVKLLPRGVSASIPETPAKPETSVGQPRPSPAASAPSAFAPGRTSDFKGGLNTVAFSPVPELRAPAASPAPTASETPWWEDQYNFYLCFYVPSKCPTR